MWITSGLLREETNSQILVLRLVGRKSGLRGRHSTSERCPAARNFNITRAPRVVAGSRTGKAFSLIVHLEAYSASTISFLWRSSNETNSASSRLATPFLRSACRVSSRFASHSDLVMFSPAWESPIPRPV